MPEFLELTNPSDALDQFLAAIPTVDMLPTENLPTEKALDRVLAEPIKAPHPLPPFDRSTVDGYAVRASDTFGASPGLPAYLRLVGEVQMGTPAAVVLSSREAALIHTGGMIPEGADAVVMIEDTQIARKEEIEILKPVAEGQNVLLTGEDVKRDEVVLETGTILRPQEIGGLLALGFTEVKVAYRPRVGIISTGDEVVPPEEEPALGQVRDINSHTLSALVTKTGGEPVRRGIIPDQYEDLIQAALLAHAEDDIVVITAGSSVSERDITVEVIAALGGPGVLVHGVSIKPGKPTILAVAEGIPVIGLPGNPVSALVVAGLFVAPVIRHLLGMERKTLVPKINARLSLNIASITGREDYQPVRVIRTADGYLAEPVFGRSNLIFTLVRADGLVRIPPEATGLEMGEEVEVLLF
jgi:molybdopterin molybdotransferase